MGDHYLLGLVSPKDRGFQLSKPIGCHLCDAVVVFDLGREEVEYDSGNFLGRGTAEEREQGYTPVLAHLGCVCCEHYSSHSSMPQTHFALVRIRSLFRPVFPKTTCFRGAMYFKLVFHVNRKIINCSCLDTFQGRKPSFFQMRRNGRGCNSSGNCAESGLSAKKVSSSADFPQNSFNENPVPIAFSDRISSTHETPRAGQVEGLESKENQTDSLSLRPSDVHKRVDVALTRSCKRPRVSKQECALLSSPLS